MTSYVVYYTSNSNFSIPSLFVPHGNVIFRGVASQVPRELHAPNRNNEKYGGSENCFTEILGNKGY